MKAKYNLLLIYFILNSVTVEAFDSCRSVLSSPVPPLSVQLSGATLSQDYWSKYSKFIDVTGEGNHPHTRMTNFFKNIADKIPGSAEGRLFRGMSLSTTDLAAILRDGLLVEKTKGPTREIFASTEMASPMYYALSRITEQNNLAVIVVIKPTENIDFQPNTNSPYVKTKANIPLEAIERVFVFDPGKSSSPFPFRELILP